MKKQVGSLVSVLVVAALSVAAAPAAAATEFGNSCKAEQTAPGEYTLTTLEAPGPLSVTAPVAGVVTSVKAAADVEYPFSIPTSVKVLRPTGATDNFSVTAEETVSMAPNGGTFAVRLPVQVGDRLGLAGVPFSYLGSPFAGLSIYCSLVGAVLGAAPGAVGLGSSGEFQPVVSGAVGLVGLIEADADGDGYGDETQDRCPQSAAVQTECPAITIDSLNLIGKKSVTVVVTTSIAAPVAVSGTIKLDKGTTVNLKSPTKTVSPGKLKRFQLKFNRTVKRRLKQIEPSQKLTLKITAAATNVAGQVSTDRSSAKLKGLAR